MRTLIRFARSNPPKDIPPPPEGWEPTEKPPREIEKTWIRKESGKLFALIADGDFEDEKEVNRILAKGDKFFEFYVKRIMFPRALEEHKLAFIDYLHEIYSELGLSPEFRIYGFPYDEEKFDAYAREWNFIRIEKVLNYETGVFEKKSMYDSKVTYPPKSGKRAMKIIKGAKRKINFIAYVSVPQNAILVNFT